MEWINIERLAESAGGRFSGKPPASAGGNGGGEERIVSDRTEKRYRKVDEGGIYGEYRAKGEMRNYFGDPSHS